MTNDYSPKTIINTYSQIIKSDNSPKFIAGKTHSQNILTYKKLELEKEKGRQKIKIDKIIVISFSPSVIQNNKTIDNSKEIIKPRTYSKNKYIITNKIITSMTSNKGENINNYYDKKI